MAPVCSPCACVGELTPSSSKVRGFGLLHCSGLRHPDGLLVLEGSMEARLSEVQKRLVQVVLAVLALALVVWPGSENRRYTAAFHEVEAFRTGFTRSAAEASLQQLARQAGALDWPE